MAHDTISPAAYAALQYLRDALSREMTWRNEVARLAGSLSRALLSNAENMDSGRDTGWLDDVARSTYWAKYAEAEVTVKLAEKDVQRAAELVAGSVGRTLLLHSVSPEFANHMRAVHDDQDLRFSPERHAVLLAAVVEYSEAV